MSFDRSRPSRLAFKAAYHPTRQLPESAHRFEDAAVAQWRPGAKSWLLLNSEPVFTPQAIYTTELRKIAGDHREATASSVAGDQQIITADRQSPALQASSDVSGVVSGGVVERQHFEPSGEALHLISILFRSRGLGRAVEKFGEYYRGGAKAVSFEIKPFTYLPRPISQHPNAKVRVEQEAKHQNTSRPWTSG